MTGLRSTILVALLGPALLFGQATVPFVGCESDGQIGPLEVPHEPARAVGLKKSQADRLAYYRGPGTFGVLGPRGWHCFYTYGSGGSTLGVRPEPFTYLQEEAGPVIAVELSDGGTSGRFSVAEGVAQAFPLFRRFTEEVHEMFDFETFPSGPYKTDVLERKGATIVEYLSPARALGLGTPNDGLLRPGTDPISGVAILIGEWPQISLLNVVVRLPADRRSLAPAIIQQFERETAKLPKPSPPAPRPNR